MSDLNVLVFHRIVKGEVGEWADVKLSLFRELLVMAKCKNQVVASINDWAISACGDLAFSFDDGHLSDYDLVFPLLKEFGVSGTFFIVPEFVNQEGYMSWVQIKQMSDAGMEIASHSKSHQYLTTLPVNELLVELRQSKLIIEKNIGKEVTSFAYPYGDCSEKLHNFAIGVGYSNICNSRPGLAKKGVKITPRNSVNSLHKMGDVDGILQPRKVKMIKRRVNYMARNTLKSIVGIETYLKLRESIFS